MSFGDRGLENGTKIYGCGFRNTHKNARSTSPPLPFFTFQLWGKTDFRKRILQAGNINEGDDYSTASTGSTKNSLSCLVAKPVIKIRVARWRTSHLLLRVGVPP